MYYLYVYNQLINLYFIECDQSAKCKYGGCMSRRSTVSSAGSRDADVMNHDLGVARHRYFHKPQSQE